MNNIDAEYVPIKTLTKEEFQRKKHIKTNGKRDGKRNTKRNSNWNAKEVRRSNGGVRRI